MTSRKSTVSLHSSSDEITMRLKDDKKLYGDWAQKLFGLLIILCVPCILAYDKNDSSMVTLITVAGIFIGLGFCFCLYKFYSIVTDAESLVRAKQIEDEEKAQSPKV